MAALILFTSLLAAYLLWAIVVSDSLFHRVWSVALSLLLSSTTLLYLQALPDHNNLLSTFVILVFVVCLVLSPVQAIFYYTKSGNRNDRSLEVFSARDVDDAASQAPILAELVPPLHYLIVLLD